MSSKRTHDLPFPGAQSRTTTQMHEVQNVAEIPRGRSKKGIVIGTVLGVVAGIGIEYSALKYDRKPNTVPAAPVHHIIRTEARAVRPINHIVRHERVPEARSAPASMAGTGFHRNWPNPTLPGDTIYNTVNNNTAATPGAEAQQTGPQQMQGTAQPQAPAPQAPASPTAAGPSQDAYSNNAYAANKRACQIQQCPKAGNPIMRDVLRPMGRGFKHVGIAVGSATKNGVEGGLDIADGIAIGLPRLFFGGIASLFHGGRSCGQDHYHRHCN